MPFNPLFHALRWCELRNRLTNPILVPNVKRALIFPLALSSDLFANDQFISIASRFENGTRSLCSTYRFWITPISGSFLRYGGIFWPAEIHVSVTDLAALDVAIRHCTRFEWLIPLSWLSFGLEAGDGLAACSCWKLVLVLDVALVHEVIVYIGGGWVDSWVHKGDLGHLVWAHSAFKHASFIEISHQ